MLDEHGNLVHVSAALKDDEIKGYRWLPAVHTRGATTLLSDGASPPPSTHKEKFSQVGLIGTPWSGGIYSSSIGTEK